MLDEGDVVREDILSSRGQFRTATTPVQALVVQDRIASGPAFKLKCNCYVPISSSGAIEWGLAVQVL